MQIYADYILIGERFYCRKICVIYYYLFMNFSIIITLKHKHLLPTSAQILKDKTIHNTVTLNLTAEVNK